MLEYKPDLETVIDRFDAWWNCAVIDRPLVSIPFAKPQDKQQPLPESHHATNRERWLDTDFVVRTAAARLANMVFGGDSLPVAWPNLGPEIFAAFYGCELEFGETTSWSRPCLPDWSEASLAKLQLDTDGFYFRKLMEMTDALIEAARDKFIVGYTSMYGGADALAAFRDPQNLLIDTLEHPAEIKVLCDRITTDFLRVYDLYHDRLTTAAMPSTTWANATCRGKFYIPASDFSCMISEDAFEDLFIPSIIRECRHMDRCIYHLDGPQALRHLDRMLEIPEIHAIQWVPGAGKDYWADWIEVYQRIQNAGKALQIVYMSVNDLPLLFESLNPEGVWISILTCIGSQDQADAALKSLSKWTRKKTQ